MVYVSKNKVEFVQQIFPITCLRLSDSSDGYFALHDLFGDVREGRWVLIEICSPNIQPNCST